MCFKIVGSGLFIFTWDQLNACIFSLMKTNSDLWDESSGLGVNLWINDGISASMHKFLFVSAID